MTPTLELGSARASTTATARTANGGTSRTTGSSPSGATTPVRTNTPPSSPPPPHASSSSPSPSRTNARTVQAPVRRNPLLPPQLAIESFFVDLSVMQKLPTITPTGFEPLYTEKDWQAYRAQYGVEADGITRLKSSGIAAFAEKLITAATGPEKATNDWTPGLQRLLLLRAASICYRNRDGFPVANKAVMAYQQVMDKTSPMQVGALWSISNAMSRLAVTPKPERIRYDAIAARANLQLSLLLLEADQVDPAEALIRQVAYHEGWLRGDPQTRALIGQVRSRVQQAATMMDFLGTQYEPAVRNDESALMIVYLYGRFVKGKEFLVADLPGRVPNSRLSQLATSIKAAETSPTAAFAAAENLRVVASTLPDVPGTTMLRQRTLYASLQHYRAFLNAHETERDRINRTLARMSLEGVISDGARGPNSIDPFAAPAAAPAGAPGASPPVPAFPPTSPPATQPAEIRAVGRAD